MEQRQEEALILVCFTWKWCAKRRAGQWLQRAIERGLPLESPRAVAFQVPNCIAQVGRLLRSATRPFVCAAQAAEQARPTNSALGGPPKPYLPLQTRTGHRRSHRPHPMCKVDEHQR